MKKNNLRIDAAASVGNKLICVGSKDAYSYEGNVKSKDPIGMTYDIVLADDDKGFDHVDVTVVGANANTLPEAKNGNVQVSFEGLRLSVSVYESRLHIKAEADNIKPYVATTKLNNMEQGSGKLGH